jgi:hypothetical protein
MKPLTHPPRDPKPQAPKGDPKAPARPPEAKPAEAQCCAKLSRNVAGCHD